MVHVRTERCAQKACTKAPSYNFKGSTMRMYCKQHAEDGMVNVRYRLCSHSTCTKLSVYNVMGNKMAVYCRQHSRGGRKHVRRKLCSYDSCSTRPSFNFEGKKTAVYCKKHAEDTMVNIQLPKRCSHSSCTRQAAWGLTSDRTADVCSHHKSDIVGGPVIHFRAVCKAEGCSKRSWWGPYGEQPTHCHDHGPLKTGLVCISDIVHAKGSYASPSSHDVPGPLVDVKPECSF